MVTIPSVTTKGAILPLVINTPFIKPIPPPTRIAATEAMNTPIPLFFIKPAAIIPDKAKMEPTERSMPPVRMTKVIPTAIMP